jgi:hypothetical protein
VDDVADLGEVLDGQPDQRRALRALYGGDQRRDVLRPDASLAANLEALAAAYADCFPAFRFRRPYRLLSSDGQVRFMVHLTQSPTALREFQRCHEASLRTGLLAGRALDTARRGQAAHALFEMYRGATTTIEELFEAASPPLDRGQLRVVLREADARGFGHFDEGAGTMSWSGERAGPQLELRLE